MGQVCLRANPLAAEKTNISAQNRSQIQFFAVKLFMFKIVHNCNLPNYHHHHHHRHQYDLYSKLNLTQIMQWKKITFMVSGECCWFVRELSSLVYYAASSGNSLPTFRNKLLNLGPTGCPKTSARYYHYLCNIPEECSSYLLCGRSLKSKPEITHCWFVDYNFVISVKHSISWRICLHY